MFVLKNAWRSVIRNKGRNVLIVIIVAIIAAAATIGLSIRQAADTARETGLQNTTVTATISLDRSKLISQMRSGTSSGSQPDFNSLRATISNKQLKLADYVKYAKASSSVKGTYYSESASVSKTSSFQPVETTSTNQDNSTSSGSQSGSGRSGGQMPGGEGTGTRIKSGDFSLTGFSSDTAVSNAENGKFTMTKGKVFGYGSASNGQVIISKSLADFNNLKVGDKISVANVSSSSTTYSLTVVGIYSNTTETSNQNGGPSRSASSDPANAIYTSVSTLKSLGLDSGSGSDEAADLSYSYVLANKDGYEAFVKDVKKAGLSSDYAVSSQDVEEYESSLVPLNNLSKFALTLLLIVLGVGAIVLITLNLFNVRERKYEVGVLTAIGVRKVKVAAQFVIELFIVTMIGLALGVAAGSATSVPVSNQLLASQVASEQTEQSSQMQQFGRQMQGGSQSGANSSSSTGGSQSSTTGQGSSNTTTGGSSSRSGRSGTYSPFGKATSYISSMNATVNLKVVGELILIGLALTVLSALVAVVFVMRYEPLQILADRS